MNAKKLLVRLLSMVMIGVFLLSSTVIAMEADNAEQISCPISITGSDELQTIDLLVADSHVYADAGEMSELFGYDCQIAIETQKIVISDRENLFLMAFSAKNTKVDYMLGVGKVLEYAAPVKSIIEDAQTAWIPFDYFLNLADSGYVIKDDRLQIEEPRITGIKLLKQMLIEGINEYGFDLLEELGHDEQSFYITGAASHLVNYFNGILGMDASAWALTFTQFGEGNSFDKKYGETLAALFVTNSRNELSEFADRTEDASDFKDIIEYIDGLEQEKYLLDFEVGQWKKTCELLLTRMKDKNPPTIEYNSAYQQLEKVLQKQENFSAFAEPLINAKKELGNLPSSDVFELMSYVVQGVSYSEAFDNQDEFSMNALQYFLNTQENSSELPISMKESLEEGIADYKKNKGTYIASNLIKDNWLELLVSKGGLEDKLLGPQGAAIKFVWDIASSYVPFIDKGISDSDKFELACYAILLQDAAQKVYQQDRDMCLSGDFQNIDEIEESLYSAYAFLKSCVIAREAGIGSVSRSHEKVPEYIEQLREKNRKAEALMADIKSVYASEDKRKYGFTPDIAENYLEKYDDSFLIFFLQEQEVLAKEKELKSSNEEFSRYLSVLLDSNLKRYSEHNIDYLNLLRTTYHYIYEKKRDKMEIQDEYYVVDVREVNDFLQEYFNVSVPCETYEDIIYNNNKFYFPAGDYGDIGRTVAIIENIHYIDENMYEVTFYDTYVYPENWDTGAVNLIEDWDIYYSYDVQQMKNDEFVEVSGIGKSILKQEGERFIVLEYELSVSDGQYVDLTGILENKSGHTILKLEKPLVIYKEDGVYEVEEVGVTGVNYELDFDRIYGKRVRIFGEVMEEHMGHHWSQIMILDGATNLKVLE